MRLHKAQNLLNNSVEAFYWLGFILADGYIEETRFSFGLAEKDKSQLKKLKKFLEIDNFIFTRKKLNGYSEGNFCSLVVADVENIPKIKEMFSINSAKTYSPPTFPEITDEQFLSLLCGYIDGDGCISQQTGRKYTNKKGETKQYIRKDFLMQVKCHSSWKNLLVEFGERLCRIFNTDIDKSKVRIDKKGYVVWRIYNTVLLNELKKKALDLGVPLMKRKWDKVA